MIFHIQRDAKDVLDLFRFLMKNEMIENTACKANKHFFFFFVFLGSLFSDLGELKHNL